jgi:hypothetical protein
MSDFIHMRRTAARKRRMDAVAALSGAEGDTDVVDFALATTLAHYQTQGGDEMESQEISTISGNRYEVSGMAWEQYVGDQTVDEFMGDRSDIDGVVGEYIAELPDIFDDVDEEPVFFWREANAEYTLTELLTYYIEDNR